MKGFRITGASKTQWGEVLIEIGVAINTVWLQGISLNTPELKQLVHKPIKERRQ